MMYPLFDWQVHPKREYRTFQTSNTGDEYTFHFDMQSELSKLVRASEEEWFEERVIEILEQRGYTVTKNE